MKTIAEQTATDAELIATAERIWHPVVYLHLNGVIPDGPDTAEVDFRAKPPTVKRYSRYKQMLAKLPPEGN